MVHNNKVLTVSYGTFSCTLEGFDDSFGTMKAIAEYFRDLASDDRYFGAEPPQPDVDMLARIAQREIARQVEAHSTDAGRIVLRAAVPDPALADVAKAEVDIAKAEVPEPVVEPVAEPKPEPTPVSVPVSVAEPVQEPTPEPTMEPEVVDVEAPEATTPEVEVADVVVEQADVIEAVTEAVIVVEPVATKPVPVEEPAADPEPVEDIAEVEVKVEVEVAVEVEVETPAPLVLEEAIQPEIEIEVEAETELTPVDIIPEPESKPESVPAADSIAAKLQRIRAVVSQNDTLVQMEDYTEDQHADGFVAASDQDVDQSQDMDEDIEDAQGSDSEILQVLSQLDSGAEDIVGPVGDENVETDITDDSTAAAEDIFADEPLIEEDALFDAPQDAETELAEDAVEDVVGQDPVDEEPTQPTAHVVKVKRADLETAIAAGQLEQIADTEQAADAADAEDSSLSNEDEADLLRELAEVEAEMVDTPDSDEIGDENSDEAEDNIFGEDIMSEVADEQDHDSSTQPTLSQTVSEDEADVTRLMAEADEKLDDPETSSNRDTYSHLRAAVAAAEAEQMAGGVITDQTEDDDYRDDLANVVRPQRPAVESRRASRPAVQTRPAPLKLVAEQRVDEGAGLAQRGPVRPRRVMTVPAPEALTSEAEATDSAFAEFAIRMGATELPDLLEAAAAYLSFVEGQEKFSRPQLMNKVRLIQQDNYNREDGLRSFGQLLRDGKIVKRGGGRFAASTDIGFRPDEREAEAEAG